MTVDMEKQTISVANTRIPVEIAGDGPPMLFLNGADAFHRSGRWIETVSKRYRVHAPKYPGFAGASPADHVRSVADLALLCREYVEQLDLRDVILVGASFGGWVALEMAVQSCDRLSSLVLIDTVGLKFGDETDTEIADIYSLQPDELRARRYHLKGDIPDYSAFARDDLIAIAGDWAGESFYAWKPYMHTPGLKDWLWRVRVPTLVLWGEHDGIVAPDYGRRVAGAISGAAFELVGAAAHYPHVEQPAATFARMEAFLDRQAA